MFTGDVESAQQPSIAFKNVPLPTSLLKYIFCAAQTFSATNVLSGPIGALLQPPQTIDDEVDIVDRIARRGLGLQAVVHRAVDTRKSSQYLRYILVFEIVVCGCGDSSPRKPMSELVLMFQIL